MHSTCNEVHIVVFTKGCSDDLVDLMESILCAVLVRVLTPSALATCQMIQSGVQPDSANAHRYYIRPSSHYENSSPMLIFPDCSSSVHSTTKTYVIAPSWSLQKRKLGLDFLKARAPREDCTGRNATEMMSDQEASDSPIPYVDRREGRKEVPGST
jgi:hypothetical protein